MSYKAKKGLTYYSDFKNLKSITTPVISNNVNMLYSGYFEIDNAIHNNDFDKMGYGLIKTRHNQGLIYCKNASKLFSMGEGHLKLLISFPNAFKNGIYLPLLKSRYLLNEYFLWGINYGKNECSLPSINCYLTKQGICFNIWSSWANFSIYNKNLTVDKNETILMEFLWDKKGLEEYIENDYVPTMAMIINGVISLGNPPIYDHGIGNIGFYYLDNSYKNNNLECNIKKIEIRKNSEFELPKSNIVGWGRDNYDQATHQSGNYTAIAAGGHYSLALKSDGSIVGWGRDNYDQATPPSGNDYIAIAAGYHHSLALKEDGSIVGWGWDDYDQATPPSGNDFIAIAAGGGHSLALR